MTIVMISSMYQSGREELAQVLARKTNWPVLSREELVDEVKVAPGLLRAFVGETLGALRANPRFLEAIPGHLPPDQASQRRSPLVLERMAGMARRQIAE